MILQSVVFKKLSSPYIFTLQVDHTRVNEFGFSGEMLNEAENKKKVTNGQPLAIDKAANEPDVSSNSIKDDQSKKQD